MSDLEQRVAAIEERLGMESGLRASQDRDLADVKVSLTATNHLLQALAITQGQHTTRLDRLEESARRVEGSLQLIIGLLNGLTGQSE